VGVSRSPTRHPLTRISAVLSIIMLLITIAFAGIVMYNFDRGLKTQRESPCGIDNRRFVKLFISVAKKSKSKASGLTRSGTEYMHRGPMRTHPNRMSID